MRLRGQIRRFVSTMLVVSMAASSGMTSLAAPAEVNPSVGDDSWDSIAEVDFENAESLDQIPDGWNIASGSGKAELVDAGGGENGNALKLTRNADGANVALSFDGLGIHENEYPYVSIETEIKLASEGRANQWSIPYVKDGSGNTVYTLFTNGDWSQYKTHVNGKNENAAGKTKLDEWQTVRVDINLKADTFRVSVDGAYVLYDEIARAKTDNLDSVSFYADSWNRGSVYIQSVKVMGQKPHTGSTVYYVSNEGDDNADGTSPETAWKTLGRVNREHFIAGDQILFRCGDEWENETLFPQGSGNSQDNKIVIGSYGEGEMPKISANGKVADAVCFYNQQYWEICDLDISNTVEGFSQVSNGVAPDYNNAARNDEDGNKLGDFRGIHIAGRDVPSLKGYHLHDLKVHDVTGVVSWIGDTGLRDAGIWNNAGLDGSKRTGGVLIECLRPSGNQPTQFSDIIIEKSEFINNSFCGITVKQWHGSGDQYSRNPGWDSRGKTNGAPDYADSGWYPHSNIIIQDNYINQGASAYACNGIYLTASRDSVIQRNIVEHIGTCGIELYFADNVAVQYNEVSDIIHKGGGADNNAIDPDWRVTNALIQYNYIHEAGEGFLLCGVEFNSGVIRYNLVKDCKTSYVHYSMGSGYFQIYNNVFYRSKDGEGTTRNFDPWGGGSAAYFNNVFYDGKGEGFYFSGGSSFAFDNNAYYGTAPTSKDKNPIILTEDPFEGAAPSMDRMGTFETGVLLEANGLRPKMGSPLIGAGTNVDPNGYSIDEGLKSRGTRFNFTPLDKADTNHLGDCINISRMDYPTFENADGEFHTAKTQMRADKTAPTIGMFEVPISEDMVILRGTVLDGLMPLADAKLEISVGDVVVTATTNETGNYSVSEGLIPGSALITLKREGKPDVTEEVTLTGGQVNLCDITIPLEDMPEAYDYTLIDEDFESQTDPVNFGFNKGTDIRDGKLVLTAGGMGNATTAYMEFAPEVQKQKAVDLIFDYVCTAGNKQGFEFRDSYGNLLFAICAAADKNDLRPSVTGEAADADRAAAVAEPVWDHIPMNKSVTYEIHVHADFEAGTVSYSIAENGGKVVSQKQDVPTDAMNLAKMISCDWWEAKPQYMDNFVLTAPEANPDLALKGKTVYAFGDSIVAGHQYQKGSFADYVADYEGMELQKYAVNGATIMDSGYSGGQIVSQVTVAGQEAPDYIIFSGGTNDAEYLFGKENLFGTVDCENMDPDILDSATFAGAFEQTICAMQQKWPETQLIYVAVHKLGSRDLEVQENLHKLEMEACAKWGVAVVNLYEDSELDTTKEEYKNQYTFDGLNGNGLPGTNGSGTHPNLAAIAEFYLPMVSEALRNPEIPSLEEEKTVLEIVNGTVDGKEAGAFAEGSTVSIKAEEKEGHLFREWSLKKGDAVIASASNAETTVTVGTEDSVIEALFDEVEIEGEYHLSVIGGTGSGNYAEGEEVTIKAEKVSGKQFLEWQVEEGDALLASPSNATTTVTMGTEDSVIRAIFDKIEDVITRITGIRIKSEPVKTEYCIGEEFVSDGLVVEAIGTASPSNAEMTFVLSEDKNELEIDASEFDSENPGEYEIFVRYSVDVESAENYEEVFEESFIVEVADDILVDEEYYVTGIEIKKKPAKMVYEVDEEIDLTGLAVVANRKSAESGDRLSDLVLDIEADLEIDYDFSIPGSRRPVTLYYTAPGNKDLDDKTFKKTFYVKVLGEEADDPDHESSGSDSSSGSSGSSAYMDAKRGHMSTEKGIITGAGAGQSKWVQDAKGWRLHYADGTEASGMMVTRADGTMYEQILWEKINGAWYPFGADGYVKSGMVMDETLGGYFLIDINTGMKTGWQQTDGVWRYFNPVSDGKQGIMLTNKWVDDWYVDQNGIWNPEQNAG